MSGLDTPREFPVGIDPMLRTTLTPEPQPKDRLIQSKRLRNWHRVTEQYIPLKVYARALALDGSTGPARERQAVARAWLASKAAA
jgi:hypothetical protein